MDNLFNTPIAFLIFKRPEETSSVFEMIKKIKPKTLLIVADGPRNKDESILCEKTRRIVSKIDWPCEVLHNYSETNLGCKRRISTGLDWVFKNVERAIILEDDCLPDLSFFSFCEDLLEKYSDDNRIMHIGGINVEEINKPESTDLEDQRKCSYHFSNIAQIWGWATWKRAWDKYDVNMKDWPKIKSDNGLQKLIKNIPVVDYFTYLYERMYRGELDTWDAAWTYTCMKEGGLCIVPRLNLVRNIGFGNGATHSISNKGYVGEMNTKQITFPLNHPDKQEVDVRADQYVYKKVFGIQSRYGQKILWLIKSNFPNTYNVLKSFLKHIKFFMK
jgi:hypothetical protein